MIPQSYFVFTISFCSLQEDKCIAFLYNDEVHSYDEVIHTLTHNIKLTHTEAVALATFVDRKGRASTKSGNEDDCLRCRELINVCTVVHPYLLLSPFSFFHCSSF